MMISFNAFECKTLELPFSVVAIFSNFIPPCTIEAVSTSTPRCNSLT